MRATVVVLTALMTVPLAWQPPLQCQEPLSKTLQLINGTPSPIGWNYNPVSVVKAVNHLRALGKEKSIAAMREFLAIARDPGFGGYRPPDPQDIATSNQWCLALLVPLVFESSDPNHPYLGKADRLTFEDGIPFHNTWIDSTSLMPPRTGPLVDWAEKYGKVITTKLRPSDNPLEAADKIYQKLDSTGSRERGLHEHLRFQAWRAVRNLIQPENKQEYVLMDNKFKDMEQIEREG